MSHPEETDRTAARPETQQTAKKVYHKPEFRFEPVFETRALSCGKVLSTQSQCAHNRKSS
ncbi:MAG TPA: hypothetical protein VK578_05485 [Edaphobacter sp.]|jgi:hypothetical protein|nr:hypothetical protein [Edaphobacter sp.]